MISNGISIISVKRKNGNQNRYRVKYEGIAFNKFKYRDLKSLDEAVIFHYEEYGFIPKRIRDTANSTWIDYKFSPYILSQLVDETDNFEEMLDTIEPQ